MGLGGGWGEPGRNEAKDPQTQIVYEMVKDLQEQLHAHIFSQQRIPPYVAAAPPPVPMHAHQIHAPPGQAAGFQPNSAGVGMQEQPSVVSASDAYGPVTSVATSQQLSPTMSYQSGRARGAYGVPPLKIGGGEASAGIGAEEVDSVRGGSARGERSATRNGRGACHAECDHFLCLGPDR